MRTVAVEEHMPFNHVQGDCVFFSETAKGIDSFVIIWREGETAFFKVTKGPDNAGAKVVNTTVPSCCKAIIDRNTGPFEGVCQKRRQPVLKVLVEYTGYVWISHCG